MHQLMGDLQSVRVTEVGKPFYNTMVDFTGAVYLKTSKIRNAKILKAYIAIFVCKVTKTIHIELVSDMTADAFIASIRRFVARRGKVKNMYSDNGTNFRGASTMLDGLTESEAGAIEREWLEEMTRNEIVWHFSPPGSPHFNGLVEAAVKTCKIHLKKSIGDVKLTFEEMTTLLTQIEAAANSKPLCAILNDPNEPLALTPAHFF